VTRLSRLNQNWSGETDHCTIPGCLETQVEIPGGVGEVSVTIDYEYDPLYRLTEADYSTGEYFWYTYDAVGNRLTQETHEGTNTYAYDIANRLIEVDGVAYTWDANGNLLDDGVSAYTYDYANRLTGLTQGDDTYAFAYNGLGDRLQQTTNGEATNYTLDLVAGLTQVLNDGSNAYLYGLARVGEEQADGWQLHLGDALGSVRQLTNASAAVTLARSYEPFGSVSASSGAGETNYSFTGEWADETGLVHLRARYYVPESGRFLSRDEWNGNSKTPMSFNSWLYVYGNPVNYTDESGNIVRSGLPEPPAPVFPELLGNVWHCNVIENPVARRVCYENSCSATKRECPAPSYTKIYYNSRGGELFVDLLRDCPGWWHDNDLFDMNNTSDVTKLSLAFEVLWESDGRLYTGDHFQAFIEAVSHKYWQMQASFSNDGLYWMLGGSESVINRANKHHDGSQPFDLQTDTQLNGRFLLALHAVEQYVFGVYNNQRGSAYPTRPYEWGNPPGVHPELIGRKEGVCPDEVYSIDYGRKVVQSGDMCVLTFHQERCITEPEKYDQYVCSLSCEDYKEFWLP
jgi:RHS repeat-associated protein